MPDVRRAAKWLGLAASVLLGLPVAAFVVAVLLPGVDAGVPDAHGPVFIADVTIVDVRTAALHPRQSVIIRNDRIEAVDAAHRLQAPPGARVLDGAGRYLTPAMWDMHTHVFAVSPLLDMPLYIAYGVTNVRDLQGCPAKGDPFIACREDKARWTREALEGRRVGPRIIEASSFMANGPGMADRLGNVPRYFDVATPQQARQFVRHFIGQADTLKVYDGVPRDAYFALVDEARRHGLPVVGHKPHAISAIEAAAHQRSIEHARFLLHESFDGADDLRAAAGTPGWKEDRRAMVDRHDPHRASAILDAMREHGTYYVPTHLARWADAYADRPEVREDAALAYLHPLIKMQWLEDVDGVLADDPGPAAREAYLDFYTKGLALTRQAQDAGVRIMVGTDYIAPGLDVHRELEQLVRAGLTPRQALMAATVTPAEYAGQSHLYGDVAPGRMADLLLLDGNPLDDIRNTQRLAAVIFNGTVYDRPALEGLREHVKTNARSWSVGAKILWRFIKHPVSY